MDQELYAIGKIVRARGVLGEVTVQPLTDFVDRFYDLTDVFLEGKTVETYSVKSVRIHKNNVLLHFDGIDSRDAAEELVGRFVSVSKEDLIELPEKTFFEFDIIGMQVRTEDGRLLGRIAEIISMPANDIWRVEGEHEFLLPAIEQFVMRIDKEEHTVIIRLMEGLIEDKQRKP